MIETPEKTQSPRKRRWFQIHLSTAIVLMFVAGGLLWANMHQRIVGNGEVHWDGPQTGGMASYQQWGYGFPFPAIADRTEILWGTPPPGWAPTSWHGATLACNVAIGLVLVFAVGVACEWRIRRQERTNKA